MKGNFETILGYVSDSFPLIWTKTFNWLLWFYKSNIKSKI